MSHKKINNSFNINPNTIIFNQIQEDFLIKLKRKSLNLPFLLAWPIGKVSWDGNPVKNQLQYPQKKQTNQKNKKPNLQISIPHKQWAAKQQKKKKKPKSNTHTSETVGSNQKTNPNQSNNSKKNPNQSSKSNGGTVEQQQIVKIVEGGTNLNGCDVVELLKAEAGGS